MKSKTATLTLAADDDNGICTSQSPAGAGSLTINGALASAGVATMDVARRILFTFAADETGRTFVVTGTSRGGLAMTENVAGTASTASTVQDFKTATEITIDAASAGAIIVGTGTVGCSEWVPLSANLNPFSVGVGCVVSGTVNYSVEHTYDSVQSGVANATPVTHSTITGKTANFDGSYAAPVSAIRLKMNSGTGTVTMTAIQAG